MKNVVTVELNSHEQTLIVESLQMQINYFERQMLKSNNEDDCACYEMMLDELKILQDKIEGEN